MGKYKNKELKTYELLKLFREEQFETVGKGCLCSQCESAMKRALERFNKLSKG